MRDHITEEEFDTIKKLVECATDAYNKTEAAPYIKKLTFLGTDYQGYLLSVFSNLVSSISNAAGQVADKEKKLCFVNTDLYKLRRFIEQ